MTSVKAKNHKIRQVLKKYTPQRIQEDTLFINQKLYKMRMKRRSKQEQELMEPIIKFSLRLNGKSNREKKLTRSSFKKNL